MGSKKDGSLVKHFFQLAANHLGATLKEDEIPEFLDKAKNRGFIDDKDVGDIVNDISFKIT
ncbi:MAG: hypothetical protein L3J02_04590, partial [Henriciella sp.]|nr:hypothetical protein [Henriciella sp.]